MKTLRRFIHREAFAAVGFVTLGFLALFMFFDLVDELRWVGRSGPGGYQWHHALLIVSLGIPKYLYQLLPIAVLIGTIFVMARFAQNSEFTIMRTSGMGPWLALRTLLSLGAMFTVLTFLIGDYVAPVAERQAQAVKIGARGRLTTGLTGAWLKERVETQSRSVNVRDIVGDARLGGIRVFEFDAQGRLQTRIEAQAATVEDAHWRLEGVRTIQLQQGQDQEARVAEQHLATLDWPTQISLDMVAAAVLKPEKMSTLSLFRYIRHLEANQQSAQSYAIEFWRKLFYPLSCLVMVVLALPFAYLHFRSGGIAAYVFGGVMAGISFFLLNNVFGYIGQLQHWLPWVTAAVPGLLYSLLSLTAFTWLVLRR